MSAAGADAPLCPVPAGPAIIRGGRMLVRRPDAELEVSAPAWLLREIAERCDGRSSVDEIVARCRGRGRASTLRRFLGDLLRDGALVDASLWAAHAAVAGQTPYEWGQPSAESRWKSGRSAAARSALRPARTRLAGFLAERVSSRVFELRAPGARAVASLLWSMYGSMMARRGRPGRTVASAGAFYSLQFHLVLLKRAGRYRQGIYRVTFPDGGGIALRRIAGEAADLVRAIHDPRVLESAAGAVIISCDPRGPALKYRNRALQYAYLEAGQALQNAALAARSLGLGACVVGGYIDRRIAALCRLRGELVLATAVFGARPAPRSLRAAERMPAMELSWVEDLSLPFHFAGARATTGSGASVSGWGRDASPALAYRKAIGEALERLAIGEARGLVAARIADLPDAVDPRELVRYLPSQYGSAAFPFRPFDPARRYRWKACRDYATSRRVYVLAECVYAHAALGGAYAARAYTRASSSGCATATSVEEAVRRGALELIERDAFARHWIAQRGGSVLRAATLPDGARSRVRELQRHGCEVSVQRLDARLSFVCMLLVGHPVRRFSLVTTAAGDDPEAALIAALSEMEALAHARLAGTSDRRLDPRQVRSPQDHADLYAMGAHFRRAGVLARTGSAEAFPGGAKPGPKALDNLLRGGCEPLRLLWADLSVRGAALEQGRVPLRTVRVFLPGLVPMAFGFGTLPLGMAGPAARGANFPHPFS